MTRTPPPHGTRACYLRGCRRDECATAHYRYMSRYRLDRERGHRRRAPAAPARNRVRTLLNNGWLQTQIADAAGCAHRTISALAHGETPTISHTTARRILAIQPGPPPPKRDTAATGTARRIRALVAIGHPINHIAAAIGLHPVPLARIARGDLDHVRSATADAITQLYRKWSRNPGTSTRSRNRAARHGWAPPAAWDDAHLDDPDARPDWTGHCGTDRGWWLHRTHRLPTCAPCEQAHAGWLQQHAHLPAAERWAALSAARAAAADRGRARVEDALELLAQGHDRRQVADRLGVSKNTLEADLSRYSRALDTAA